MSSKHFDHNAMTTCLVHKVITRGLENIISKCNAVEGDQLPIFFTCCQIWGEFLFDHHHHEELVIFPCFVEIGGEKFVQLDHDLRAQHDSLLPTLEEFLALTKTTPSSDKLPKLKELAEKIGEVLLPHLKREEETLCNPEFCEGLSDAALGKMHSRVMVEVRKHPPERTIPMVAFHLNAEERKRFQGNIPWVARKMLFSSWAKKHAGVWQGYSPYVTKKLSYN